MGKVYMHNRNGRNEFHDRKGDTRAKERVRVPTQTPTQLTDEAREICENHSRQELAL